MGNNVSLAEKAEVEYWPVERTVGKMAPSLLAEVVVAVNASRVDIAT